MAALPSLLQGMLPTERDAGGAGAALVEEDMADAAAAAAPDTVNEDASGQQVGGQDKEGGGRV